MNDWVTCDDFGRWIQIQPVSTGVRKVRLDPYASRFEVCEVMLLPDDLGYALYAENPDYYLREYPECGPTLFLGFRDTEAEIFRRAIQYLESMLQACTGRDA